MQKNADLAGLARLAAIPLTLLTKRTGTATVNAGSVHDTQASIGFSAVLMWGQCLVCWAPKRSIGLESPRPGPRSDRPSMLNPLVEGHSQRQERCAVKEEGQPEQTWSCVTVVA